EAGPESEAPEPEAAPVGLSALVEKLAEDRRLFEPLDDEDDIAPVVPGRDYAKIAHDETVEAGNGENQSDWGLDDAVAHEEAVFAADGNNDAAPERAGLWRVTGRGLTVSRLAYEEAEETAGEVENAVPEPPDQASRYNFEELSRILTDRVGREEPEGAEQPPLPPQPEKSGASLVALSEEAMALNRLPMGILIFRDQDI